MSSVPAAPVRVAPWIAGAAAVFLLAAAALVGVEVVVNDDTYVYFTYARQFVAGRYFAYDVRNLPSEGFSSLFYLLLLVPFEALHVNMPFASVILGFCGLILGIALVAVLFLRAGLLESETGLLFGALLSSALIVDENVRLVIGRGLETTWSPVFPLVGVLALVEIVRQAGRDRPLLVAFFAASMLAFFVRPESVLGSGAVALLFLAGGRSRGLFLRVATVFAGIAIGLAVAKLLFFDDLLPTGYYRKFAPRLLPGRAYVASCLRAYAPWIVAASLSIPLAFHDWRRERVTSAWAIALVLTLAAANLLFGLGIRPLIGYGSRFLFLFIFSVKSLATMLAALAVRRATRELHDSARTHVTALAALAACVACVRGVTRGIDASEVVARTHLLDRARAATASHHYLRFAAWVHDHVPDPGRIALASGDAGAMPYALGGIFVDLNGLTEPYIAHLFRVPDPAARAQRFSDYVISLRPNLLLLATGAPRGEVVPLAGNDHGPFREGAPIEIWRRYRSAGYRYLCSLPMYYDMHFAIDPRSPVASSLAEAIVEYAERERGYVTGDGLTVASSSEAVTFPAYEFTDAHWRARRAQLRLGARHP